MQALCGLQGIFLLFNCQTPGFLQEKDFFLEFAADRAIIETYSTWGYSSAGRAIRSQRIGHEFESRYLHK